MQTPYPENAVRPQEPIAEPHVDFEKELHQRMEIAGERAERLEVEASAWRRCERAARAGIEAMHASTPADRPA